MRRYLHRWLSLLVVLSLLAAACTSTDVADDTQTEPTDEGDEPAPVELTVWLGRESHVPPDEFAGFMERYPHITVNWDVIPIEEIGPSVVRIGADSDNAPDYFTQIGYQLPQLIDLGLVLETSDLQARFEEEDPDLYNQLAPAVWGDVTFGGGVYSFAPSATFANLYYRVDWFEELGLAVPETWDEVLDAARAIVADDPSRIGFAVGMQDVGGAGQSHLISLIPKMMGVGVLENEIMDLDSEAGHYYLSFYQTLAREGLLSPDSLAWHSGETRGAFAGGQAAMYMDSDGTGVDLDAEPGMDYNVQWAIAPTPLSRSGEAPQAFASGTIAHFVHSASENPYEASLLWRWLSEPDQAWNWTIKEQTWRSTIITDDPEFEVLLPWLIPILGNYTSAERTYYPPDIIHQEDVLMDALQELFNNPDQDVAETAARYQLLLESG